MFDLFATIPTVDVLQLVDEPNKLVPLSLEELKETLEKQISFMPSTLISEQPNFSILRVATTLVRANVDLNNQTFDLLVCGGEATHVEALPMSLGVTDIDELILATIKAHLVELDVTIYWGNKIDIRLTPEQLLTAVDIAMIGVSHNQYLDMNDVWVNELVIYTTIRFDMDLSDPETLIQDDCLVAPKLEDLVPYATASVQPFYSYLLDEQAKAFLIAPRLIL